jgi:hypothetical protein
MMTNSSNLNTEADSPYVKFTAPFVKIRRQTKAKLIFISVIDADSLHPDFVEYDSLFYNHKFQPRHMSLDFLSGKILLLVFLGNKMIPFATVRPYTESREKFYRSILGKTVDVRIEKFKPSFINGNQEMSNVFSDKVVSEMFSDKIKKCVFINDCNHCGCPHINVDLCTDPGPNCSAHLEDNATNREALKQLY